MTIHEHYPTGPQMCACGEQSNNVWTMAAHTRRVTMTPDQARSLLRLNRDGRARRGQPALVRALARCEVVGDCWEFGAHRTPSGYGEVSYQGRSRRAHRVVWAELNGPIPDGLFICHTCDNPPCCNPAHLFLGTAADNTADQWAKGRGAGMYPGGRRNEATHCKQGHEFTEENTYHPPATPTWRQCRTCKQQVASRDPRRSARKSA